VALRSVNVSAEIARVTPARSHPGKRDSVDELSNDIIFLICQAKRREVAASVRQGWKRTRVGVGRATCCCCRRRRQLQMVRDGSGWFGWGSSLRKREPYLRNYRIFLKFQ